MERIEGMEVFGLIINGVEKNEELFKAAVCKDLDPNGNMWFMFSIDQNPNYEMQENLMSIAERYHLG